MEEEYERANARQWDESLQATSSTQETRGDQLSVQQALQQLPARPRVPLAPLTTQYARNVSQHGNQHRPQRSRNIGRWQGVLPMAQPRRRVGLLSDACDVASTMPKLQSNTPKLRAEAQQRWENELKCQQYRQHPPSNFAFDSISTFHWPSSEYRPDEVLGANSEALDPVRMNTECYIVWSPGASTFTVFGGNHGVQKALDKLKYTYFQIASRNIAPIREYITYWRTAQPCLYVHLDEEYENPQVLAPVREPLEVSKTPRADGKVIEGPDLEAIKIRESHGIEKIKTGIAGSLLKLHYLCAHVQFRIRLGTLVLASHKYLEAGAMWSLSEYEEMTNMPQFRGRVTEELGDRATESDALARLQAADNLLLPHDHEQDKLSEVKPTYSVEFVFKHEAGDLQLSMAWARSRDRAGNGFHLVLAKEKWIRLDRDTGKATVLVDMHLVNLQTGSAWNFDIKTSQAVEQTRVPAELKKFGKRVNISVGNKTGDHPSVTWAHGINPVSVKESTVYRYNIRQSDYTLELSRFRVREIASGQSSTDDAASKVYESRWGLSVYRTEWDNSFAKNERLKISEKADWDDEFEEWFPADASYDEDGNGYEQLLEKLGKIESLIRA